jgi:hypothetical protein
MVAIVLVPWCPSRSRTWVAAVDGLVASWACKRPSSTPPESLGGDRQPSRAWPISMMAGGCHGQAQAIHLRATTQWKVAMESVTGIRRVKGVKRLGRKIGNWLTGNQAQELLNAVSQNTLQGRRDGAMLGLLLGCGLRRSEVVGLTSIWWARADGYERCLCRIGARGL